MIEKMTKYSWILLSGDKQEFLERLRTLGVVDITRSSKPVDRHSQNMLSSIESTQALVKELENGSDAHLTQLKSEREELAHTLEEISVWGDYDRSLLRGIGLPVRFHCVQTKRFEPLWAENYPLEVIGEKDGKTWFVTVGADDFPVKEIPAPTMTVSEARDALVAKEMEIEDYSRILLERKSELPRLRERISSLQSDLNLYLASIEGETEAEDKLILYRGFAPTENDEELKAAFGELPCVFISEAASTEDNPPIKLKNNSFVQMFEVLTDMYGRPKYDGFDPTPYISIFFLLFFAICMGDMGYGLVLIIIGLLLRKAGNFAKFAPLVMTLGGATVLVGFFFHTFFSMDISKWAFIPEGVKSIMVPAQIAGYDGTMVLALVVGIIHLLLAMVVKTVYATRNKGFKNSLSIWGWTVFWVGLAVIGLASLAGVMDKELTKFAIIALGVVCAIGIFPLNNLQRNPLVNIGSGLWDTYNMATGILGDVLSYLRLYALGLAGAMLGFAFNDLALMALGNGGLGWIPFIIIVIVGHTLNIAMAALGAFVHPLRLNFLEFFKNSDYDGSGLKYNPLEK